MRGGGDDGGGDRLGLLWRQSRAVRVGGKEEKRRGKGGERSVDGGERLQPVKSEPRHVAAGLGQRRGS